MRVLHQHRIQCSKISLVKNYCLVPKRPLAVETDVDSIDGFEFLLFKGKNFRLANKKNKNKVYFYSNNENGENLDFDICKLNGCSSFVTTDEQKLKKYYGHPFASIHVYTKERKITINGNNLTIKCYTHVKFRELNWKHFSKTSSSKSVTINLKTGNITTIEASFGKSKNTSIKKNSFFDVYRILTHIFTSKDFESQQFYDIQSFPTNKLGKEKRSKFKKMINDDHHNEVFFSVLYEFFNKHQVTVFTPSLMSPFTTRLHLIFECFVKLMVHNKKIKTPNNYFNLMVNWYPTKKFLVKNDNKLIAAILDRFDLKSKYLIKLLHQHPNINLYFLIRVCYFFGENYIKYVTKINPKAFLDDEVLKDHNYLFGDMEEKSFLLNNISFHRKNQIQTEIEKSRAVKFFNSPETFIVRKKILVGDFEDHLKMLHQIKYFYPDKTMKANSAESFKEEHMEFTKLNLLIKRGESIEYTYKEDMLEDVEKAIKIVSNGVENIFYPVVLKKEEEYIEEGSHMHHCVASYVDKESSFIVSLRLNSKIGTERVTSEYNVNTSNLIQSRYFCNAAPPEMFEEALQELHGVIYRNKYKLKWVDKKVNSLQLNGIDVSNLWNDMHFDETNRLMPLPF